MDKHIDIEALRASLQGMTRGQVRALAAEANLSPSTVEKFRLNHIAEPKLSKLQAISAALVRFRRAAKAAKPTNSGVTAEPAAQ